MFRAAAQNALPPKQKSLDARTSAFVRSFTRTLTHAQQNIESYNVYINPYFRCAYFTYRELEVESFYGSYFSLEYLFICSSAKKGESELKHHKSGEVYPRVHTTDTFNKTK